MMQEWRRSRKPSGLRSRGYVGTTASKCGMKLSTKLGLRLHLYLERQRVYTTPLPSEHLAHLARGLILPPRWQKQARTVQLRSQPFLTIPSRWPSSPGSLKRKRTQTRAWPLMPRSPPLPPRTLLLRKKFLINGDSPGHSSPTHQG